MNEATIATLAEKLKQRVGRIDKQLITEADPATVGELNEERKQLTKGVPKSAKEVRPAQFPVFSPTRTRRMGGVLQAGRPARIYGALNTVGVAAHGVLHELRVDDDLHRPGPPGAFEHP